MGRYILKRAAFAFLQLLIAGVGVFLLLRIMPVDPVSKLIGISPTPEAYMLGERKLGLDRSLPEQLGSYLGGLFRGDLGTSWDTGRPVAGEILDRVPVTLQFVFPGFLLAVLIGIPLGLLIAAKPGGRFDRGVTGYSLFAGAQPDFWWGLVFAFIFFFKLGWLPAPLGLLESQLSPPPQITRFILIDALIAGDLVVFWSAVRHLVLPIFTIAFVLTGPVIKMTRENAESVFRSEWILYARASGLPERQVRRQALRVAVAPVMTLSGILFGFLLGGAVLTERVFSLSGIGTYALSRILSLDFPAVQGAVLVLTMLALGVYLFLDLLHSVLDPRVRLR